MPYGAGILRCAVCMLREQWRRTHPPSAQATLPQGTKQGCLLPGKTRRVRRPPLYQATHPKMGCRYTTLRRKVKCGCFPPRPANRTRRRHRSLSVSDSRGSTDAAEASLFSVEIILPTTTQETDERRSVRLNQL
eukprot:22297-Amphidinium_carterae.1